MSDRVLQINEQLRAELARAISQSGIMDDGLITVAHVKCSPDLKNATVVVSVLPENKSGTALKLLRRNASQFKHALTKLKLKFIPKLCWRIDSQARYASEMDKFFNELEKQGE